MEIQVHVDDTLQGVSGLITRTEDEVVASLGMFEARLTSVQLHLEDEGAVHKGGPGIRCMVEVHPAGHEPVVVTHHAPSVDEAVRGASRRMRELLTSTFERLDPRHPGAATIRGHGA